MKEDVKTNVNFNSIIDYVPYVVNIDMNTIKTFQLPGISENRKGYGWFFYHDEEETKKLVDEFFNENSQPEENAVSEGNAVSEENTVAE